MFHVGRTIAQQILYIEKEVHFWLKDNFIVHFIGASVPSKNRQYTLIIIESISVITSDVTSNECIAGTG